MKNSQTEKKNSIDLSGYDIVELKSMMEIIMAGNQALGQMKESLQKLYQEKKIKIPPKYYADTVQKLNFKIQSNNSAIMALEKETKKMIQSVFPKVNIFTDIDRISMEIEKKIQESNTTDNVPVKKLSKA